ncbi:unnamed protein product [Closterium sp. NIES-65]|nr:unnamed protein product [Closterium sp. NIES-65]
MTCSFSYSAIGQTDSPSSISPLVPLLPPTDADSTVRSQWATRDAAARLAVRRHLRTAERALFSQYKNAKTLYDAVVARYSSPATAALSRLILPYLFPDLAAFPTVADLGCSPSPLLPFVASATAVDFVGTDSVGAASALAGDAAPAKARGARALEGLAGAVEVEVEEAEGVGVVVGVVAGVGPSVAAVAAEAAAAVAVGAEEETMAAVAEVAAEEVELVGVALLSGAAQVGIGASSSSAIVRPRPPSSFVSGTLGVSEAAALGAGEAATLGASASAASSAGESALSDRTTLTPLRRPVAVSLADPSGGPVLASFSTVLPCPAAPSGTLTGLYLPSFSTNLVSGADLQDWGVDQLSFGTTRLGHPSLPRLRGMASRVLVSGLPRSLPPLPPGPAPTCVPCVEGRQRAAPQSSEFPPTEAPLQTLHMDVWGPARVRGQGHERYFLLVVDDYSRYTTVFPLRNKGDVTEVLIDWIRAARL